MAFALVHVAIRAEDNAPAATPSTPPAAPAAQDALNLDSVVVTGTSQSITKMKSSVSISTMSASQIQESQASSASDLLRSIPGVHVEASGGESNANLVVRGIPLSAGGARYVQYQEDGLPVLQIGDLDFLTPDTYIRADRSIERLEVIRGGSASTTATNAPGGIVNFISKTGDEEEGVVALETGLNYDEKRYEFSRGGAIGEKTHYYVGGFYRDGEGPRKGGVPLEGGGQLRANITQTLDNGYVRLSFKELDDRTPTYLPVPVNVSNGNIQTVPGIDPRTASLYSPYLLPDVSLTANNGHAVSNVNDGLKATSTAIGAESGLNLGSGWSLDEKFRTAKNGGRFLGVYGGSGVAPAPGGTTFLTGPSAGQAYTGGAFTAVVFNTSFDDASLTANDLKLSKKIALGDASTLTAAAGLYTSSQRVAMTWNFNQYLMQATGDKPAILSSTIDGTPGFGGCCERVIDATYRMTSPYASLGAEIGPWNFDGSVRRDDQKATGYYRKPPTSGAPYDLTTLSTPGSSGVIDYSIGHTSYSFGGNFRLSPTLAFFARYSDGVSFNGDRIAWGNPLDGSTPIKLNEVKQFEGGAKLRFGPASLFATLFQAKTAESNYDLTKQQSTAFHYSADGIEFEGGYVVGNLHLNAGLTLTNAKITGTAPGQEFQLGQTPQRWAHTLYQAAATYDFGPARAGISVQGTSSAKDNTSGTPVATLPGYAIVNVFATYAFTPAATVSLGVSNLFNQLAYTEFDGASARAMNGTTAKLGISYAF
ncbi:MAG TPA: TonB-dependent receptor [Burkholderiaceae bacterium]|nr:TonB-dependent receptor [Burkholderiaceae bacterium]